MVKICTSARNMCSHMSHMCGHWAPPPPHTHAAPLFFRVSVPNMEWNLHKNFRHIVSILNHTFTPFSLSLLPFKKCWRKFSKKLLLKRVKGHRNCIEVTLLRVYIARNVSYFRREVAFSEQFKRVRTVK